MAKKLIPTHKYKTTVIFLDDNKLFLKFLEVNLHSKKYNFQFTDNLQSFYELLKNGTVTKQKLPNILVKLDNELDDHVQHNTFDFNLSLFEQIKTIPDKAGEVSLVFVDNNMGHHSGLEICSKLREDVVKVLLTGECEKSDAIQALNDNTINLFLEKNQFNNDFEFKSKNINLIDTIINIVDKSTDDYFIMSNYYNNSLLSNKVFKGLFSKTIDFYNIVEYYLCEKDTFLLITDRGHELLLKCWEENDFENYYYAHYDDQDNQKKEFLDHVKHNKKIPTKIGLVDTVQLSNLYYCITDNPGMSLKQTFNSHSLD